MSIRSGQKYRLVNGKALSCLDVIGNDVIGNTLSDDIDQRWLIEYTGSGWTMKFIRTGEYLGLAGECGDGTNLALKEELFCWDIWPDDVDPSKYRFFVYGTKYCFNVADYGNPNPGTTVILWTRHHDTNQIWDVQEGYIFNGSGLASARPPQFLYHEPPAHVISGTAMSIRSGHTYRLVNGKAPESCLDISGESVIGNTIRGDVDQRWLIEYTGSGWTMKFIRTGGYLGLAGSCSDGSDLALNSEPFPWDIWPDDIYPSKYRFFVYGTKFCFDLADYGNPNPGTTVILWTRHHDANQIWDAQEMD